MVLGVFFLAPASPAGALGELEVDLEFDAYYGALGLTIPFFKEGGAKTVEKSEAATYRELFKNGFIPRFMVIEASVNPLPLAGLAIRRYGEYTYNHAKVTPNLSADFSGYSNLLVI